MATGRSGELRALAQRVVDLLPVGVAEEVVLTGSVSWGMADELSDVEMLVVSPEQPELAACFAHAHAAGLDRLDSWGPRDTPAVRVSGWVDGVPLELIWWSREHAEARIPALLAGETPSTADALVHGVALRTGGRLCAWQELLRDYPPQLAATLIERAAETWGGYAPEGYLTLTRPGERLALAGRLVDDAARVVRIVFALNRVWEPTHKRLAQRVAALPAKPERLAERIEEALAESEPRRALLVLVELAVETVGLAPSGPNVDRAREWLPAGAAVLR